MKKHNRHIESLLELFMQGETTLEQERELREFFAHSTSVPDEWEDYKEMFAYFDAGMPIEKSRAKRKMSRPLWATAAAAALVALAVVIAPRLHRTAPALKPAAPQAKIEKKINSETTATVAVPEASPIMANNERKVSRDKSHNRQVAAKRNPNLDSIEVERERGEMEKAQQELMADKYIAKQERQEILDEQYNSRVRAHQVQQARQNENPQFIQVVFK